MFKSSTEKVGEDPNKAIIMTPVHDSPKYTVSTVYFHFTEKSSIFVAIK